MKVKIRPVAFFLLPFATLLAEGVGDERPGWFAFSGGAERMRGGAHVVSGSIGQGGMGEAQGGAFTVRAGFWAGVPNSPVRPELAIVTAEGSIIISWNGSAKFVLEEASSLAATATWMLVADVRTNWVTVIPSERARFYRLRPEAP